MTRLIRTLLLVGALAALTTTLPGEVPCCDLRYEVRPDPEAGLVDVSLTIHGFRGDTLDLVRPSARPLVGMLAQDPRVEGERRGSWDLVGGAPRWRFAPPAEGWPDPIHVTYRLSVTAERPLNAWSVGLDRDLLYAPAEALFLLPTIPGLAVPHARVSVGWDLPRGWDLVTGLERSDFRGLRGLVKTNVLAGEIETREAEACGMTVELGIHGAWAFEPSAMAEDVAAVACAARYRLGAPGSDRIVVTLVEARFPMTSGNRNGPHAIGFVHRMPDGRGPSTRLLAHEVVHLWQRFDAPTWFQEGVNDFLALRLAREGGLFDAEEYAAHLAAIDSIYRDHPRRGDWSFADESREARPFGPSDGYLAYRKGALVGLALDRELRLRTGGEADLAVLWRDMNERAGWGHVKWTDHEIAARAATLAGGSVSRFFGHYVEGTEPLPPSVELVANLPRLSAPPPHRLGLSTVAAFLQAAFD